MKNHNTSASMKTAGTALAAAGLLTACFGGGNNDATVVMPPPAAATGVPDSALASSSAYEAFTDKTASSTTETAEPLTADNVATPPGSETDEPAAVS